MNFAFGRILDEGESAEILRDLPRLTARTVAKGPPDPERVARACGRLARELDEDYYLAAMGELGIGPDRARRYLRQARRMFSEESLRCRLQTELPELYGDRAPQVPPDRDFPVTKEIRPLGVLMHVAAGNADGLPAFSVLEGLLAGNVNILKLPAQEGGVSVRLLSELLRIDPGLAEYIYVFDYSSRDLLNLKRMMEPADAVVVWGGSGAVEALRGMVPPHIRLIEWGHKVSFVYVTPGGVTEEGLRGIARNIAETGQLFCSSAQGVFLDTEEPSRLHEFSRRLLFYLERELLESETELGVGLRYRAALELYTRELESGEDGCRVFRGEGCSVTAFGNRALETSLQFGNPWVRTLPRGEMLEALRPYKNFLQTAGLLCGEEERGPLAEALFAAGCVRVCPPEHMSDVWSTAPHDGEYPLRRYTRITVRDRL